MRKNLLIGIGILIFAAVALWFLFTIGDTPAADNGSNATSSPFGLGDISGSVPAAQPDFEGEVLLLGEPRTSEENKGLKLFKLEAAPVAGFVVLTRGSTTSVRYADRGTGNIFETKLPDVEKKRLTNETLPQIYEAHFRDDGLAVLFRTLDENDVVKNMALSLTAPRATSTDNFYALTMILLRGEIDSLSTGPGDLITYVLKDADTVTSSKFNGESAKNLWRGSFDTWRTGRLGAGTLVFTKPSSQLPGYAYRLSSGNLVRLIGPYDGLIATANPAGTHLIYSYAGGTETKLFAEEIGKSTPVEFLPSTLADKCVGSAQEQGVFYCGAPRGGVAGTEPDLWYQGKTRFSDDIWRFNALTESADLVLEPETNFGVYLDVSLPQFSSDEKYLVFVNRTDLSLWALTLR